MFIECEVRQLNKHGEELCGDNYEIVKNPDNTVIVLSDGLGSGVKANILSTMTKKIASTMLLNGMEVEEVVETLVNTLPVCQIRKMAYSTFSIVQIFENNEVKLVEFDSPGAFYVHNDALTPFEATTTCISGKNIKISNFNISKGDYIVIVTDGVIHAGIGGLFKSGWGWDNVSNFIQRNVQNDLDASILADKLLFVSSELYQGKIGDDTSVAVIKVRDKKHLSVVVGPPADKNNDNDMVKTFLNLSGRKVVCGGTTANILARALDKEINVIVNESSGQIPPKAEIEGLDLVTEGIITLSKMVDIFDDIKLYTVQKYENALINLQSIYGVNDQAQKILDNTLKKADFIPQNPAEELALEFHKADYIKILVGTAINPAHQNPGFPVESGIKIKLINELKDKLLKIGKEVEIEYY